MSISSAQLCYDLKLNTHSFHPSDIIICQRWAVSMFNSAHFQNLVLFMCITLVFFLKAFRCQCRTDSYTYAFGLWP